MAFTGDFLCNSFKREILVAEHNFTITTGDTFNLALYDNNAAFTASTTAYTATNELADGVGNYTAKGKALTNVTPTLDSGTAITDFVDPVWSTASFTAYGALLFNDSHTSDASVCVLDFGSAKTATAGDFTVQFPVAAAATAIIRIA